MAEEGKTRRGNPITEKQPPKQTPRKQNEKSEETRTSPKEESKQAVGFTEPGTQRVQNEP